MEDWKNKIIYQIYPRSFLDTSGNGIGDLNGIKNRIDYIADLGVDYVWISPFFKSPQKDFGYDVSDYRKVDTLFGLNDDFKKLLDVFHNKNLKVITDLVLSHTSDEHEWFKKSKEAKKNKFSDWYVWQDPTDTLCALEPQPNNWLSVFGGSSWEYSHSRDQYYLHNFLTSQPDLNFHNEEVQNQMLEEIEYWLKFGVDGFRFDVINFLFHDKELRDNPYKDPKLVRPLGFNKRVQASFNAGCANFEFLNPRHWARSRTASRSSPPGSMVIDKALAFDALSRASHAWPATLLRGRLQPS